MNKKLSYLTVGNYYLNIKINGESLIQKIMTWFPLLNDPIGEYLGKIEFELTNENYSDYPLEPNVTWEENQYHFKGKDCKGIITEDDSAILKVNSPMTKQYAELFFRVVTAIRIFSKGGLLVHAAGIEKNDKGYLFTGHSGAGKTTVCKVSKDCTILNDDMVILSFKNDTWFVSSTPFTNDTQVQPNNGTVPLHIILHLIQAEYHLLKDVTKSQIIADLMTHVPVISLAPNNIYFLLNRCNQIVANVQGYDLYFLPNAGFWDLLNNSS